MKHIIAKLIFVFGFVAFSFSNVYANLTCATKGDFFPFPWSAQASEQILSQEWPLVNPHNQVTSYIVVQAVNVYFTEIPAFIVKEYDIESDSLVGIGTALAPEKPEEEMNFRMFNVTGPRAMRLGNMGVKFGVWVPKAPESESQAKLPYLAPEGGLNFAPRVSSGSCSEFITNPSGEVFGLVIQKTDDQGSEYPDVYFSFKD